MKHSSSLKKALIPLMAGLVLVLILGGGYTYRFYQTYYQPNTHITTGKQLFLYVPDNATFEVLMDSLDAKKCLIHRNSFLRAAKKEGLGQRVKGGRYKVSSGMSNRSVVRMLALGLQAPVNLTISGNIRSLERLSAVLSRNLESDSLNILQKLNDTSFIGALGFDSSSVFSLILPNTYQVYWNISTEKLFERLHKEYLCFWNQERRGLAATAGLSILEVSTLASIVYEESNYAPEMPAIAGVYINRLHQHIPLQADPTLKFALKNPAIKRVLNVHKEIESPYNTYKYSGLPPGPICIPSLVAIDAVLRYQKHNYLYFCASPDFNGSHRFAAGLNEHNRNAAAYQKALNQRGIFK